MSGSELEMIKKTLAPVWKAQHGTNLTWELLGEEIGFHWSTLLRRVRTDATLSRAAENAVQHVYRKYTGNNW